MAHIKFCWSAVLNHHTLVSAQPSVPRSWRRTGYKLAKSLTMDVQKDRLMTGSTPWFYTRACAGLLCLGTGGEWQLPYLSWLYSSLPKTNH